MERQARTYPHGVPCWIDTEQPDPAAARAFYGELLGWEFTDVVPAQAPGSYWIATLDGADVAAIGPGEGEASWNVYVAVDDADASCALVWASGGAVTAEPADAGPGGRGAVCADPAGAPFRVWQARQRLGAQVANVPGAWNFSDLQTSDAAAAKRFYGAIFGWEAGTLELGGGGGRATMLRRPGYGDHLAATVDPEIHARQEAVGTPPGFADVVAWLGPLASDSAAPRWNTTISVSDRDDAVATAERLGATVLASGQTAWALTALIRDPQGARLTLSQFTPPDA